MRSVAATATEPPAPSALRVVHAAPRLDLLGAEAAVRDLLVRASSPSAGPCSTR
ncbi:MAG TPA: hypothetical protein VJS45_11355 [Acidimicrobiia bacterium]|nr:hypothetical protein [Acidimicrobiia bacterium]